MKTHTFFYSFKARGHIEVTGKLREKQAFEIARSALEWPDQPGEQEITDLSINDVTLELEESDEETLRPGQQTDFATFVYHVVEQGSGDTITTFTVGDFRVLWYYLKNSNDHIVSDEFDVFFKGAKLDAHEQLKEGETVDQGVLTRLATLLAPGTNPKDIQGTVS